ncbi:MAG: GNAT family N-acetyltransferase [Solirubrobacterales bacterium]|nr:GNAT family N-acetyltransferase [Solirubrobacterales bacterium]
MIAYRTPGRDDIPAMAELVRAADESQAEWAGETPMPTVEEEALEWELRFAAAGSWIEVAETTSPPTRIVGAAAFRAGTVSREDRTPVPGLAHVNAVFVHPSAWRRGIARTLLEHAVEAMRAAGFDRAQLWTLEGSPAEDFYRAQGWARDGRRDHYPPMGLDVVAYVRTL